MKGDLPPGGRSLMPIAFRGAYGPAPSRTRPRIGGHGLVQQPGDELPAGPGERGDPLNGKQLTAAQVGDPYRQRRAGQVAGTPAAAGVVIMRAAARATLLAHAALPPYQVSLTGTVGGASAVDDEPLRRSA